MTHAMEAQSSDSTSIASSDRRNAVLAWFWAPVLNLHYSAKRIGSPRNFVAISRSNDAQAEIEVGQ
jgi:hypothetical protein